MKDILFSKMYRKLFLFLILFIFIGVILWNSSIAFSTYFINAKSSEPSTVDTNKVYHYGAIIDAGSSGSRLFLYTWPTHSGNSEELLDIKPMLDSHGKPISKKITPGLSSYADKPDEVMDYIKKLIDVAANNIPASQHRETPLYVMATAGMRMISKESQQKIFENIRKFTKTNYRFLFSDSHAKVITGREEGIYGWITTNYLLGRFNHNHTDNVPVVSVPYNDSPLRSQTLHHRKRTVGVIDMGGGSMQIAYELDAESSKDVPSTNIVKLGCKEDNVDHTYKLFVTTFLGFGANIARTRYERMLLKELLLVNTTQSTDNYTSTTTEKLLVEDPCLHPGLELVSPVRLVNDTQGGLNLSPKQIKRLPLINVTFKGTGLYPECKTKLEVLLDNKACSKNEDKSLQCTMAGRLHPQLDLKNMQFYGFSEFWYSTNDVFELGGPYNYFKLHSQAVEHCRENWFSIILKQKKGVYRRADWPRLRYECFKSAWITTVLHEGLGFPVTYNKFTSVMEINGAEVQWSLGALLYQTRFFPLRVIEEKERQRRRVLLLRRANLGGSHIYLLLVGAVLVVAILMWMHSRHYLARFMAQRSFTRNRNGGKYSPVATIIPINMDSPLSAKKFNDWM